MRCDDCERLDLDQQKCPHWIILRRKGIMFVSVNGHTTDAGRNPFSVAVAVIEITSPLAIALQREPTR